MDEISSWALDTVGIDTFKSCVLACSFQYFYKKSELASIMLNKKIMLHVRKKKKKTYFKSKIFWSWKLISALISDYKDEDACNQSQKCLISEIQHWEPIHTLSVFSFMQAWS